MFIPRIFKLICSKKYLETKRSYKIFSANKECYILALKRMKYVSGQTFQVSQACISKLMKRKPLSEEDNKSLLDVRMQCIIVL